MMGFGNGCWQGFGMGGFEFLGMIIPIILIGVIIYAIVKLVAPRNYRINNNHPYNDALEILDKKFANGEITAEEYTKKKNMILK